MAGRAARGDVMLVRFPRPDKEGPVVPITSTIRGVPSEVVLDETDGMHGKERPREARGADRDGEDGKGVPSLVLRAWMR